MMQYKAESTKDISEARKLDLRTPFSRTIEDISDRSEVAKDPRTKVPVTQCFACGRLQARLTLIRSHGQAPLKLCLRCHHGVMQQRKMLRVTLTPTRKNSLAAMAQDSDIGRFTKRQHHVSSDVSLIVSPEVGVSGDEKYATLARYRRRAQVAARRALELEAEPSLLSFDRPNLLGRAG